MWELTSKKTGKVQIVTDAEFARVKERGWLERFRYTKIAEKLIQPPKIVTPETKKIKTNKK